MNYCDKHHINQLTALLIEQQIHDIVVCPGSRNGILVHNFSVAKFCLHPVTDERSAGFVALGLCLSTHRPVVLCVTSGSALLNTLPAVAEAHFRHLPLLVISADRPKQWIGQLDGQTLAQNGALQPYAQTYVLDQSHSQEETHWHMLRMNEAILSLQHQGGQPVHINVPIEEPLFTFNTAALPQVKLIHEEEVLSAQPFSAATLSKIKNARFPILVIGQYEKGRLQGLEQIEAHHAILVLPELIAGQDYSWRTTALEHLLPMEDFQPDLVIHMGGNLVNKQLKLHLRRLENCEVIRVESSSSFPDTFSHLTTIVRTTPGLAVAQLAQEITAENPQVLSYQKQLDTYSNTGKRYQSERFSDLGVFQQLSQAIPPHSAIHIANSSVIRNATYFLTSQTERLYCNRGTNGIEGSLSTAVGYALANNHLTIALMGDLSFFYDQNALWNKELPQQLRIVLFNNGGGQIFYRLPGLDQTPALAPYIAAGHQTQAKGIAESYGLRYLSAHNAKEVEQSLSILMDEKGDTPVLLEVFTQTEDNEYERKQIKRLYKIQ